MNNGYPTVISDEKIRESWAEQERLDRQREEYIKEQKEKIARQHPQFSHLNQTKTETETGETFYKTHQEQELWMAADEKNGDATYNNAPKKLTTLEIRNLRSELKDLEGDINHVVKRFQQLDSRKKYIEKTLGISE